MHIDSNIFHQGPPRSESQSRGRSTIVTRNDHNHNREQITIARETTINNEASKPAQRIIIMERKANDNRSQLQGKRPADYNRRMRSKFQ